MQNSDTGATALNDFAAHGLEQGFDFPPFNIAGNRVSENGVQSFSMVPVHTYCIVSFFATISRKNILTPYDIVRIKNRLGLTADMFLQLYTTPEIRILHKLYKLATSPITNRSMTSSSLDNR